LSRSEEAFSSETIKFWPLASCYLVQCDLLRSSDRSAADDGLADAIAGTL